VAVMREARKKEHHFCYGYGRPCASLCRRANTVTIATPTTPNQFDIMPISLFEANCLKKRPQNENQKEIKKRSALLVVTNLSQKSFGARETWASRTARSEDGVFNPQMPLSHHVAKSIAERDCFVPLVLETVGFKQ